MTTETIQFRRGIEAQRSTVVFLPGEPAWTTDLKQLWIGDGVTTGGILIANSTGNSSGNNYNFSGLGTVSVQTSGNNVYISGSGNAPSVNNYFTGLRMSITGNQNITDGLGLNQGYRTNRINLFSGNYTGTISLMSGNAFAGGVLKYILYGSGVNPTVIFKDQATNNTLAIQSGLSGTINTLLEFGNDGTQWLLDSWI